MRIFKKTNIKKMQRALDGEIPGYKLAVRWDYPQDCIIVSSVNNVTLDLLECDNCYFVRVLKNSKKKTNGKVYIVANFDGERLDLYDTYQIFVDSEDGSAYATHDYIDGSLISRVTEEDLSYYLSQRQDYVNQCIELEKEMCAQCNRKTPIEYEYEL